MKFKVEDIVKILDISYVIKKDLIGTTTKIISIWPERELPIYTETGFSFTEHQLELVERIEPVELPLYTQSPTGINDSGERTKETTGALTDPSNSLEAFELLSPYALFQLSAWLGKGAKKYAPRNWEKGIKFSICVGKLQRHLQKWIMGLNDEDHLAAVGFWWHALSHYEALIKRGVLPKDLDDLPRYENKGENNV